MDPIYFFLKAILKKFYRANLYDEERLFIEENTKKHQKILWLNVFALVLILVGLQASSRDRIDTVVSSLIAPVMVLGTAWFTISFGGIPQKLITVAMSTTFWLFAAFSVSLTTMFVTVSFIVSLYFWPVLLFIYIALLTACIQYDTADGLKVGLDETILKHSRAALRYYHEQGIKLE